MCQNYWLSKLACWKYPGVSTLPNIHKKYNFWEKGAEFVLTMQNEQLCKITPGDLLEFSLDKKKKKLGW